MLHTLFPSACVGPRNLISVANYWRCVGALLRLVRVLIMQLYFIQYSLRYRKWPYGSVPPVPTVGAGLWF